MAPRTTKETASGNRRVNPDPNAEAEQAMRDAQPGIIIELPDGTKTKIVSGVASAAGSGRYGGAARSALYEGVMVRAIEAANAAGISDPDQIRALQLQAREKLKAELDASDQEYADKQNRGTDPDPKDHPANQPAT